MRAHLVQLDIRWEDRDANHARVLELLTASPPAPGDLVLLPELFDSGFSLHIQRTHDGDARTLGFLAGLARRFACTVQGGRTVLEPGGAKATNRMTAFTPQGAAANPPAPVADYAKVHPFSYGREPESFVGGPRVLTYPWSSPSGMLTVCPAVCYDLRFPELFRAGLLAGAEAFALGANWPSARHAHWRALAIARAIENQAFMLAVNRTGADPHLEYAGGSLAVSPDGRVLAEGDDRERVVSADLDPATLHRWRAEFGAWRDHRLLRGASDGAILADRPPAVPEFRH